jgi:tetratricopeptide (TPR) repeat protein
LGISLGQPLAFVSALCVAIVTVLSVRHRRRTPALAASLGAYVMLVLPVSGLMQTGIALRHAYLAILPLVLLGGGAAVLAWRHSVTVARVGLVGLLACDLCVFGLLTHRLIPVWHDDETLWRTVLSKFPDSPAANRSLVQLLLDQGRSGEALEHAQRWVEIMPGLDDAHFDLGSVLDRLGRPQDAVEQYEQAVRINPNDVEAYVNLGSTFLQMGRAQAAIEQYEQALRIDPDSAAAHSNLGAIYQRMGKLPEAVAQYEQALRIKPDYVEAHFNLGLALEKLGRTPEAIAHYQQAVKLQPDFAPAKNALTRLRAGQ